MNQKTLTNNWQTEFKQYNIINKSKGLRQQMLSLWVDWSSGLRTVTGRFRKFTSLQEFH